MAARSSTERDERDERDEDPRTESPPDQPPPPTGSDPDELHTWFRARGLPTLVPIRAWGRHLPFRVAPAIVFLLVALPGVVAGATTGIDSAAELVEEEEVSRDFLLAVSTFIIAAALVLAVLAYLGVRRLLRRLSARAGQITGWLIILVAAVLLSWPSEGSVATGESVAAFALLLLACLGFAWCGAGAFVTWAARAALRHLGAVAQMASFAVPVILMLVIFAFFSAEIWQLTAYLTWPRLLAFAAAIATLATLVVLRVSVSELNSMRADLTPEHRATLLVGTPGEVDSPTEPLPAQELSSLQRANVLLVMSVAQLVLGGFFALTQAGLLMLLGKLTMTVDTMTLYVGTGTETNPIALEALRIGDHDLPITVNLIKTSIFLGLLAALSFVVSSVSEPRYRAEFFDPILEELHQALAVYDASCVLRPTTPADTSPAPSEPDDRSESPPESS